MHKQWRTTNKCPYCGRWFVVVNMLHYHLEENQCGLVPPDWSDKP
jgi:hypothetical protein